MKNKEGSENKLAAQLIEIGYRRLFQNGGRTLIDSIWQGGKSNDALEQIVLHTGNEDYVRLLASEVLYFKNHDYPLSDWNDTLAHIYSQALAISGQNEGALIPGNQWGFMYHTDKLGINDFGNLGKHLMNTGKYAIPSLAKLLDDNNFLVYEGSRDATTGNSLKYRVKDAAAYYIGKIAGVFVKFYESNVDRDAEIERLKEKLK